MMRVAEILRVATWAAPAPGVEFEREICNHPRPSSARLFVKAIVFGLWRPFKKVAYELFT